MRLGPAFFAAALASALLAGCATSPPPPAPLPATPPVAWWDLPGWGDEDHLAALRAVHAACRASASEQLQRVCARLAASPPADAGEARRFLETNFRPERIAGEGLLTGYYAPEYEARSAPEPPFTAPVRPRPPALPATAAGAAPDRAAIEAAPAPDALAWMRPEDLFFLQVQGSGVLALPDGRRLKAAYAGSNGLTFVPLARVMREAGLIDPAAASSLNIHAWLAGHRGSDADALMRANPRYVFFSLAPDDGAQPAGAAGIPLPPGRSAAADPAIHPMGELLWVSADAPLLTGAAPAYRRLVAVLDTGSAIKGEVRLDLYFGRSTEAGVQASRTRHRLTLFRLKPLSGDPPDARGGIP